MDREIIIDGIRLFFVKEYGAKKWHYGSGTSWWGSWIELSKLLYIYHNLYSTEYVMYQENPDFDLSITWAIFRSKTYNFPPNTKLSFDSLKFKGEIIRVNDVYQFKNKVVTTVLTGDWEQNAKQRRDELLRKVFS